VVAAPIRRSHFFNAARARVPNPRVAHAQYEPTPSLTTVCLVHKMDRAAAVFTDPPYNVPIYGHASGLGKKRHKNFVMGSGEMSEMACAAGTFAGDQGRAATQEGIQNDVASGRHVHDRVGDKRHWFHSRMKFQQIAFFRVP
jgi:hypothetical protein